MEARITPAVGFGTAGRIRLGAQAVGLYRNPEWFGGFGPSVSLRALSFGLEEIALLAVVDHMWWAGDQPSSGASLLLDLDGLFRIGLRVTRDWPGESTSYMINLGADLPNVLKIGRGPTSGAPSLPSDSSPGGMP